jgi:adenosylcobinamide-phosphate synthase
MTTWFTAMAIALVVDAAFGWPAWLYNTVGHPVTWIGRLIGALDRWLNRETDDAKRRRTAGIIAAALVVGLVVVLSFAVQTALPDGPGCALAIGLLAWPLVAARSMYEHVAAVARPLDQGDLTGAREAVAMIVGRDPSQLDEAGVSRAAIESLAENTSDGVVAPLFWGAILGLPGIAGYKAINTLDSMIGHRTPRHDAFGWASAKVDDMVNFIPARLTGFLFALVSSMPVQALRCMMRDAKNHRSPNAGWPEAAMAGALGVRISGPRVYGDRVADEPWVNAEGHDASAGDLDDALGLYVRAMVAVAAFLALVAYVLS